ncbi:MAG TPA: hypothetical protein VNS53_09755 [Sphingomicrobium sp.]|jgi:hypothetical protein|nr:hypothetical protein [Sphingomicrobium sp.]
MFTVIPAIFLLAASGQAAVAGLSIGDHFYGHAMGISDGVDFTLRPAKIQDCRTEEDIQQALAEKDQKLPQHCILPKSALPAKLPR